MNNYAESTHFLLFELGKITENPNQRLIIEAHPSGQGFLATIEKKEGKSYRTVRRLHLKFGSLSGEEALPILSRIEWDEQTQQIQQRMPVKYVMQSQKPAQHSHVWGFSPKIRRTQAYPLSGKKETMSKRKRRGRSKKKKVNLEELDFSSLINTTEVTKLDI